MDINNTAFNAIKNYYNVLESTGYMKDTELYNLLVFMFITELTSEDYNWYITTEDYKLLDNIVTCLSKNSCIIPYCKIDKSIVPIKNYMEDIPIRMTENAIIRLSESVTLRLLDRGLNQ